MKKLLDPKENAFVLQMILYIETFVKSAEIFCWRIYICETWINGAKEIYKYRDGEISSVLETSPDKGTYQNVRMMGAKTKGTRDTSQFPVTL